MFRNIELVTIVISTGFPWSWITHVNWARSTWLGEIAWTDQTRQPYNHLLRHQLSVSIPSSPPHTITPSHQQQNTSKDWTVMLSWEKTSKTSKKLVRFVYRGVDEEDGEGILANSIIDHLYFANMFNILPLFTWHELRTGLAGSGGNYFVETMFCSSGFQIWNIRILKTK